MPLTIVSEHVEFEGKIFQIVKQKILSNEKELEFEVARRSPGTRVIILKQNSILMIKEYRKEQNGFDYRLPGGKVFDTLNEYKKALETKVDLLQCAIGAAKKELKEETGISAKSIKLLKISKAGATVDWDLYYFIANEFEEKSEEQNLELGEEITAEWKTSDEIKQLCKEGKINEDRTVGILLNLFLNKSK